MTVRYLFPITAIILLSIPLPSFSDDAGNKKKVLTLQECIDTAVSLHPSLQAARSNVNAGESRIDQAYSSYYPQLSATTAYNRISTTTSSKNSVAGTKNTNEYNQYTGSINLNQNIYDFGKTSAEIDIQKTTTDAARQNFDSSLLQVIYNVKVAYYGLLQARKNRDVAQETVTQMQMHLDQANGYFEVHLKSRLDVTTAEMNLGSAKLSLIQAEDAISIAIATLNNAIGIDTATMAEYDIEDNMSYTREELDFDGLVEQALKNRPDYLAEMFRIKSLTKSIELADKGFFPSVNGTGSYSLAGSEFPLNREWNLGVNVTLPIFSGFATTNQIREANANLNAEKANAELVKQQIILDVKQAIIKVKQAEKTIPVTELTEAHAAENLELANGRYQAGVGNMTEVSDAQASYISAKNARINALYNYRVARAALDKSIGARQ